MPEKQKPIPKIVKIAAKAIKDPSAATKADIKSMAARILDDERNDPQPHKKTAPAKKSAPAKKAAPSRPASGKRK